MAAIVYFKKTFEDTESVTYNFGPDENDLKYSFIISKAEKRPTDDPEKATFNAQLAFGGIIKGYRKQGRWPERGAGIT